MSISYAILRRGFIGTLVIPTMVALPLVVSAPHAVAQGTCGTFNWGVKQSYRNYVKGPIADGSWSIDGGSFQGSETGSDGAFVFPADKASNVSGDTATIPLQGKLNFRGHNYGGEDLLDMTLFDLRLEVKGSNAQLIASYDSYESDMVNKSHRGNKIEGRNIALIDINLAQAANTGSGTVDMAGNSTLTGEGAKLFLNYSAGEVMDPTSGSIKVSGECAGGTGGTGGGGGTGGTKTLNKITGKFTGANKEVMDIVSETNDTMNGLTTFMGNAQEFKKQVTAFTNDGKTAAGNSGASGATGGAKSTSGTSGATASGGGAAGTSGASDASGTPGGDAAGGGATGNGAGGAGDSGGGGTTPGGAGAAAGGASGGGASGGGATPGGGAAAGGTDVCTASGARGVQNAKADWGVKKSFRSYITGSIAKGKWTLNGVTNSNGIFHFTGKNGAVDPKAKSGTIGYGGGILFTGHNGVLNLNISNLEIQFKGNSGTLIANVNSSDTTGKRTDFGRVALGTLSFTTLNVSDSQVSGKANVSLSAAGAKAFADFYQAGTQLDPISFNAALGAAANCAQGQGAAAAGSAGGAGGAGDAGGAGGGAAAAEALKNGGAGGGADGASDADGSGSGNGDSSGSGYQNGANKFKVKSAGAGGLEAAGMTPMMYLLLAVAAFVVGGGSMGRLVKNNPAI